MMPQGAKDSRSHACMEERLPLAPASHEEEARRADSEWAGISKKSQGASSVVRGHLISSPPEEGAPKGRLPNGGFGKWREATPIPLPPRGRSPAKGDFQMGASESGERPFPSPRPQRKEPPKGDFQMGAPPGRERPSHLPASRGRSPVKGDFQMGAPPSRERPPPSQRAFL